MVYEVQLVADDDSRRVVQLEADDANKAAASAIAVVVRMDGDEPRVWTAGEPAELA